MTIEEADHVESVLQVTIPAEYRRLITDDGFCAELEKSGMLLSQDDMLRENRFCRETAVIKEYWRDGWLAIHADGCGNFYFLDTTDSTNRVFDLDHEKTFPGYDPLERAKFPSITAFVEHLKTYELQ